MENIYISYQGLRVYILDEGADLKGYKLPKGTAIVSKGHKDNEGNLLCFFEGNLYGACNLRTFESRAICAAGRLVKSYPTIAKGKIPCDSLIEVGVIQVRKPMARAIPVPRELIGLPKSVQKRMLPRHLAKELDPDPKPYLSLHCGARTILAEQGLTHG